MGGGRELCILGVGGGRELLRGKIRNTAEVFQKFLFFTNKNPEFFTKHAQHHSSTMEHLKQERTAELSTRGFTTIAKLKTMLEKLGIKLTKKSMRKAELIHILVEHEFKPELAPAATPFVVNSPGTIDGETPDDDDDDNDDER